MLTGYLPILVMLVVAAVVAIGMVAASALLGPKHPTKYKSAPYECGMTPVGSARERFPIRFYLIAMLFIIFDIETIFLYPWAVSFRNPAVVPDKATKLFFLAEMAVFVLILFIGYAYLYGKGALDWNEDQIEAAKADPKLFRRRPPIRFGNENSGPVQIPAAARGAEEDGREVGVTPTATGASRHG